MAIENLTLDEFLSLTKVSRSALYRFWREGRGPETIRVNRRVLIPADAAATWLDAMRVRRPSTANDLLVDTAPKT
jgi:predicted DNA-binding transcriptional regulator AlpA